MRQHQAQPSARQATEAEARTSKSAQRMHPTMALGRTPRLMHEAAWLPRLLHQPRFAEKIGLDEAQATAIRERLIEYGEQMRDLREQMEAKAAEQAALMEQDPIDEDAVMTVVEALGAIQTQINRLRVGEVIFMRQALTEEQLDRVAEIMPMRTRAHRQRDESPRRPPEKDADD